MNIIDFVIPNWALSALINADMSGLTDEDEAKINKFVDKTVAKYGYAIFSLPEDDELDLGFKYSNDIDNLGSDCSKLLLVIS